MNTDVKHPDFTVRQDANLPKVQFTESFELSDVQPNKFVRVSLNGESFWCKVLYPLSTGTYICRVDNDLVKSPTHDVYYDDLVCVKFEHILDIYRD